LEEKIMSNYVPVSVAVPAEVAAGAAVKVSPRSTIAIGLSGTFVGTVQLQWSPDKSGSVWKSLGAALTAPGWYTLQAGRAARIRANTTAYTSGAPVCWMLHDNALSAYLVERQFKHDDLDVEASVAIGDAYDLEDGEQAVINLSGTFSATIQVQVSLSAAGDDWFNWSMALSAVGTVIIPRGIARRVRMNTTVYSSGTPVATIARGFSAEMVQDNAPETLVADGAVSLFTEMTNFDVTGTQAWSLGDGFLGQHKYFGCVGAASSPVGVLTPDNFVDGTNLTFGATTHTAHLIMTAAGWKIASLVGATLA
jgi:hypothetical protein